MRTTSTKANTVAIVAAAVALVPMRAHAQAPGPPPPITLSVDVPPECPSDLAAQVLVRTPRTRVATPGEPARRVGARIVASDGRYHGAVALDGLDGQPVVREVEGPSCSEVTAALALIAALAIDPDASMAPLPPAPLPALPPPPTVPTPPPVVAPPPEPPGEGLEVQPGIEAGLGLTSGLAPRVIFGGVLMLQLGVPRRKPVVIVRAGAGYWASAQIGVEQPGGGANAAATYRAALARVETCVTAVRIERFWGSPCATFDAGSLMVEGAVDGRITEGFEESQLWLAPGPGLRLGWDAIGPLTVAVDGALTFPLKRDSYVFEDPDETAFEVPPVALRSGLYATLHFR